MDDKLSHDVADSAVMKPSMQDFNEALRASEAFFERIKSGVYSSQGLVFRDIDDSWRNPDTLILLQLAARRVNRIVCYMFSVVEILLWLMLSVYAQLLYPRWTINNVIVDSGVMSLRLHSRAA